MGKEKKSKEKVQEENLNVEENSKEEQEVQDQQEDEEKDFETQLKEKDKKIQELEELYKRTLADFENFRRRKEEEMIATRDRAINDFIIDILPAIDNFEMSLKMTDNKDMFIKGVEMIHKNLIDTLKEHKIEQYHPEIGEDFDPYYHEPQLVEHEDSEPGKVINILQKGYKKGDKIVRPARVQVASDKNSENNQSSDEESQ